MLESVRAAAAPLGRSGYRLIVNTHATIRNYLDADLMACRRLWVELTEWHRTIYDTPSIGGDRPELQFDALLGDVGPQRIWLAELKGEVVGLTGLILEGDQGELEPIVVSPRARGAGIGRLLAERVIQEARAGGVRQLSVRPVGRNASAIGFFHQLGFDIIGQIELFIDLAGHDRWQSGEEVAGLPFRV